MWSSRLVGSTFVALPAHLYPRPGTLPPSSWSWRRVNIHDATKKTQTQTAHCSFPCPSPSRSFSSLHKPLWSCYLPSNAITTSSSSSAPAVVLQASDSLPSPGLLDPHLRTMKEPVARTASPYVDPSIKGPRSQILTSGTQADLRKSGFDKALGFPVFYQRP
jgi:hypothetical protein